MEEVMEATMELFKNWLQENAMDVPLVAWGPSHTRIACQFAEFTATGAMLREREAGETRDIPNTEKISQYMHCGLCLEEFKAGKGKGESPQTYARLSVGWTELGFQVWCYRHGANVLHVDFQGQKHPANTNRKKIGHGVPDPGNGDGNGAG